MNPAMILMLIILVICLWFLASFLFEPFGKFIYRIYKDAKDNLFKEEKEKKE